MKPILVLVCLMQISYSIATAQQKVRAEKIGDRIDVHIGNLFFTSYHFASNEKYPFFYPVNGPSGASVTSKRNGTYPHHSSLFFGCDKVNGGNYWQESLDRGQIVTLRAEIEQPSEGEIIIHNENIWTRPGATAPIKDIRKISISSPAASVFQIDFEVEMEMLQDVVIEKTNHSLFSGRMDPDLAVTNGGTLINAEGQQGEKATFGQPSPWMDFHGPRGDGKEGMAILQHPSNNWYPSPWFTRDYGFFSPTPMYWPENDKDTRLKKGEMIKLKYRVLVHSGDHLQAEIAKHFATYAK